MYACKNQSQKYTTFSSGQCFSRRGRGLGRGDNYRSIVAASNVLGWTKDEKALTRKFQSLAGDTARHEVTLKGAEIGISDRIKLVLVSCCDDGEGGNSDDDCNGTRSNLSRKKPKTANFAPACVGCCFDAPTLAMTEDPSAARKILYGVANDDFFKDKEEEPPRKRSNRRGSVTELEMDVESDPFTETQCRIAKFMTLDTTIQLRNNLSTKNQLYTNICQGPTTGPYYVPFHVATKVMKDMVVLEQSQERETDDGKSYILKKEYVDKMISYESQSPPSSRNSGMFNPGTAMGAGACATVGSGGALILSLFESTANGVAKSLGL